MRKKQVWGRAFLEPFENEPNWYKYKSYDDVFKAVRKDIDDGLYSNDILDADYLQLKKY